MFVATLQEMPYDLCVKNRQQNILIITVEEMRRNLCHKLQCATTEPCDVNSSQPSMRESLMQNSENLFAANFRRKNYDLQSLCDTTYSADPWLSLFLLGRPEILWISRYSPPSCMVGFLPRLLLALWVGLQSFQTW